MSTPLAQHWRDHTVEMIMHLGDTGERPSDYRRWLHTLGNAQLADVLDSLLGENENDTRMLQP